MHKTYLGFDFGMKHIGVAFGQSDTQTATPIAALSATNGIPNWPELLSLLVKWEVEACVVGIPLKLDGEPQHITRCATKFANRLHEKSRLPIFHADERLTSVEAKQLFKDHQLKDNIHAYSAKLILESWLRENT